jgi:hypothetical protein
VPSVAYARGMGKAGMKRKGRTHLPKAGTRPAREAQAKEHRARGAHPFAVSPSSRRGTGWAIASAVLAVVVVVGIIALIAVS